MMCSLFFYLKDYSVNNASLLNHSQNATMTTSWRTVVHIMYKQPAPARKHSPDGISYYS